jgi:hypothetical protein
MWQLAALQYLMTFRKQKLEQVSVIALTESSTLESNGTDFIMRKTIPKPNQTKPNQTKRLITKSWISR